MKEVLYEVRCLKSTEDMMKIILWIIYDHLQDGTSFSEEEIVAINEATVFLSI